MQFIYNDGGRAAAGYKGHARDCVCRAVTIISGKPYQEVYDALNETASAERPRLGKRSSSRTGVKKAAIRKYLADLGYRWVPTMHIGQGCKVHLVDGELPSGRLIVSVSRHLTAVIDGVIYDTHDPQRQTIFVEHGVERVAERCVYGYWVAP